MIVNEVMGLGKSDTYILQFSFIVNVNAIETGKEKLGTHCKRIFQRGVLSSNTLKSLTEQRELDICFLVCHS